MKDKDPAKNLNSDKPTGTITIQPHPDEVIDADPAIVAGTKARLAGHDHLKIYDRTDRTIDDLALQREKQKLKRIFGSIEGLREAFSSLKGIERVRQEMELEKVDRELLKEYCYVRSHENNVDEVDFYGWFVFGARFLDKDSRMEICAGILNDYGLFEPLFDDYARGGFSALMMRKEAIQLNPRIAKILKEGKLADLFNGILHRYYGSKI